MGRAAVIALGIIFWFLISAWNEVRATRILMRLPGVQPRVYCRACGVDLENYSEGFELAYGAVVCEDCNDEIELEVGLAYPDWFDKALPPEEGRLRIPPPETFTCEYCAVEHPTGHICLTELKKYVVNPPEPVLRSMVQCKWCPCAAWDGAEICDFCIAHGPPHPYRDRSYQY